MMTGGSLRPTQTARISFRIDLDQVLAPRKCIGMDLRRIRPRFERHALRAPARLGRPFVKCPQRPRKCNRCERLAPIKGLGGLVFAKSWPSGRKVGYVPIVLGRQCCVQVKFTYRRPRSNEPAGRPNSVSSSSWPARPNLDSA
jgi:hypothetical protein